MALGDLLEDFFDAFEGREFCDFAAQDLFAWQSEGFTLAIIDSQVTKLDGVEEGKTDGRGLVDSLQFGALTLSLLLTLLKSFGKGFTVVDVDGDAEPMKDLAGVIANRLGAKPPPTYVAVASA